MSTETWGTPRQRPGQYRGHGLHEIPGQQLWPSTLWTPEILKACLHSNDYSLLCPISTKLEINLLRAGKGEDSASTLTAEKYRWLCAGFVSQDVTGSVGKGETNVQKNYLQPSFALRYMLIPLKGTTSSRSIGHGIKSASFRLTEVAENNTPTW